MTLENIDVYVAVVEAQSFTKAAKFLKRPTSTVSAQIAKLESHLGVTLLQRTTRQLRVTDAGQTFYQHCVNAMAEMKQAEQALSELNEQPAGTLRISAPVDLANAILAPVIKQYCAQSPKVKIELLISNQQVDLVKENVDLALRIGTMADSSLIARRYLDTKGGLWASKAYLAQYGTPATIEQLAEHQLIRLSAAEKKLTFWDQHNNPVWIDFDGQITTDDMQSCLALIKCGAGIAMLPNVIGEQAAERERLEPILTEYSTKNYTAYFVYPTQQFLPLTVRSFLDFVFEQKEATD